PPLLTPPLVRPRGGGASRSSAASLRRRLRSPPPRDRRLPPSLRAGGGSRRPTPRISPPLRFVPSSPPIVVGRIAPPRVSGPPRSAALDGLGDSAWF
ncbi:Os02g0204201, partial [Oryza sativa Japonica Group]